MIASNSSAVNGFGTGKMDNNIAVSENKEGYTGIIAMTYLPQVNIPNVSVVDRCKVMDAYGNFASGSYQVNRWTLFIHFIRRG